MISPRPSTIAAVVDRLARLRVQRAALEREEAAVFAELRQRLQGEAAEAPARVDLEPPADADGEELLETWEASERFGVPEDTVRLWARKKGIGVKPATRWLIYPARMRELLLRRRR